MSSEDKLKGKVAAILNSRELALNIGADAGVKTNMIFVVLGEVELKDPDTKEVLGMVYREKGRVKVVSVEDKYSTARTFETYEVNIGGLGEDYFKKINEYFSGTSASRLFTPPNWVTRVKTLEYEESGLEKIQLDKDRIFVKVGDIVELAS